MMIPHQRERAMVWILVLFLMHGDGQAETRRVGPYRSLDECQAAGERWRDDHLAQSDVRIATWECPRAPRRP